MGYNTLEKRREWYKRNKQSASESCKRWYEKNRHRRIAQPRKVNEQKRIINEHRAMFDKRIKADKSKKSREKLRIEVIVILGGCCVMCGIDEPIVLEIDHIVPLKRRTNNIKNKDAAIEWRLIRDGKVDTGIYQVLCSNCHTIKTKLGGEHVLSP